MSGTDSAVVSDRGVSGSARTSVVVLGYRAEPYLAQCLQAIAAQLGPDDELVLVDNGIEEPDGPRPELLPGVIPQLVVVGDGGNRGFAGGCLLGVLASSGDVLIFCNSDAIVRPQAIARLGAAVRDHPERGLVGGCLRLAEQPDLVNSVGNPLQFLGLTWAGRCGEPAIDHQLPGPVAIATGGLFALRRRVWDQLGGFDERYFAYHEDTDLSLRSWLRGWSVTFEPAAIADHYYEFSRNSEKFFLLERNRLITVLTDYPTRLLALVLPALVMIEPALLVMAVVQGWGLHKVRAWYWLLNHRAELVERRKLVQATVSATPSDIASLMMARIEPPMVRQPPGMEALNTVLSAYWWLVLRRLSLSRQGPGSAGQGSQLDDEADQRAESEAQHDPR